MKNEIFEIVKNNKPKAVLGILAAGLFLSQCDIQKESYSTLEQMRINNNTPENRYRIDYGGNVKWLKDENSGSKWDDMGKDQCLKGTDYDSSKVLEYVDEKNVLHVQTVKKKPELKFEGIEDTSRRLRPADTYTAQYLFSKYCQVTDY